MAEQSKEITNKDLLSFMAEMREEMTENFGDVRADIRKLETDLRTDIQRVENKVDRALFKEIDRLEAEIKKIKEHVGLKN